MFQSTRPCGARHKKSRTRHPGFEVSIHAPLRGATGFKTLCLREMQFQSTRPCGARPRPCRWCCWGSSFNPRAPAGRDLVPESPQNALLLFQSTRPCGARRVPHRHDILSAPFQSTRPCGARLQKWIPRPPPSQFQSTRPCGARPGGSKTAALLVTVSIHAPLRGATSTSARTRGTTTGFNPRAPAGRDVDGETWAA